MSEPSEKTKNATRRYRDEVAVNRQVRIAKSHHFENDNSVMKEPHRLAKRHAMDCGNAGCYLCGNRRQHEGLTTQEKRFYQDVDDVRDKHSNGLKPKED